MEKVDKLFIVPYTTTTMEKSCNNHIARRRVALVVVGLFQSENFSNKGKTRKGPTWPFFVLSKNIHSENIKFIRLDGSNLPIKKEIFDFIFCSSTIEHVPEPNKLLDECNRILKPTGTLYLTFPPFYSLPGGHKFKPFHYLGEKIAVKMLNKFNKKEVSKVNRKITSYATAYDTHGLYVLKITDVKNLLSKSKFVIKTSWIRLSPINFSKIPILNEFLSWHINFIAKKN